MIGATMVSRKKDGEHALHSTSSASRHRLGEISDIEAATRIQAHYRGNRARRRMHRISHSEEERTAHRSERASSSDRRSDRRSNSKPKDDAPVHVGTRHPDLPVLAIGSPREEVPQENDAMDKDVITKDKRMESNVTDYSLMRYELNQKSSIIPRPIQRARVSLYLLFEEPRSSIVAQVLSIFLLGCIIISIACFMLETMPELEHVDKDAWLAIEVACTAVFTVEYVVRLLVCTAGPPGTTVCQFIRTPMNMCDLGAILPFYVSLIMSSLKIAKALGVLRTVRLIRLFRIFKLGRYSSGLQLMASALKNSSQALWVLGFFLFIGIVLFSSAIYYVEKMSCPERETLSSEHLNDGSGRTELDVYVAECRSSNDGMSASHGLCCDEYESPLDFPSIVAAFWWATVTMTTVGFGEVYPRTDVGRLVATATMLSGILLIALPVAIIGRKFQEAYDEHQAALQGYCDVSRSTSFGSTPTSSARMRKSGTDHTAGTSSDGPTRKTTQKSVGQRKHGDSSSNAPDGPTLSEMGRRLRLMKLPDGSMTLLAHDLAEELEEASDVQKEINSMQSFETNRQAEVVEQFDNLLKRLCELQSGSALAKLARFSPRPLAGGMKGSLANVAMSDLGKEIASPKTGGKTHPVSRETPNIVVQDAEHPCAVSGLDAEGALAPGTTPPPYKPPPPVEAFQAAQALDPNSPRQISSREISTLTSRSEDPSIGDVPTVNVPDTRCETLR